MAKITTPFFTALWFLLFLLEPIYEDFLASSATKYLFNYRLVLLNAALMLFLTWLSFVVIANNSEKKELKGLILKILALYSFFGLLSSLLDEVAYYFSYYFNFLIAPLFSTLLSLGLGFWLFYKFLISLNIHSKRLAITVFLPCALLLVYNFFQENGFFSKPKGRYEIYNSQLRYAPEIKTENLADFLAR